MSSYVPAALNRSVRIQFADRCAYCQTAEALTVTTFEIEHIVPLAEGGATELTNLCLSCPTCNRHKATHTTAIDPQTRESVPLFHPQQELWESNCTRTGATHWPKSDAIAVCSLGQCVAPV